MKLTLVPVKKKKKAEQKIRDVQEMLNGSVTAARYTLLLGGAVALLSGIVIGFLCAPDRTRTFNFGTNTVVKAGNEADALPAGEDDADEEEEADPDQPSEV